MMIVGGILAGGGGIALVTAMTMMDQIGSCGNGYDAPCPPGIENDFYLMGGAVVAIAIGSVMSWGAGLGVAVLTAGVTALVYSQTVPAAQTSEFITAGVCFGLLALAIALVHSAMRRRRAKLKSVEEHIGEERRFMERAAVVTATVTALRDTGATFDDNPEAGITVSYTRADGATAQLETIQVVPRLDIPRRGDPATVWYASLSGKAIAKLGTPESHGYDAGSGAAHAWVQRDL